MKKTSSRKSDESQLFLNLFFIDFIKDKQFYKPIVILRQVSISDIVEGALYNAQIQISLKNQTDYVIKITEVTELFHIDNFLL